MDKSVEIRQKISKKIQWETLLFKITIPANTSQMTQIGDSKHFENPYQFETLRFIAEKNSKSKVRLDIDGDIYPRPFTVDNSNNYVFNNAIGFQSNALLKPDAQEFTVNAGDDQTVENGTGQTVDIIDVLVESSSSDYDISVEASVDGSTWIEVATDNGNSGNTAAQFNVAFGDRVQVKINEIGGTESLNCKVVFTPAIFEGHVSSCYPFKYGTEKGWTLKFFGVNNSPVDQNVNVYMEGWKVPVGE